MMNDSAICAKLPAFCLLFSVPVIQVGFCKFALVWSAPPSLLEFLKFLYIFQVGGVACVELESGEEMGDKLWDC